MSISRAAGPAVIGVFWRRCSRLPGCGCCGGDVYGGGGGGDGDACG